MAAWMAVVELCYECYLIDHELVYPDQPLPQIANVRFD